MFYQQNIRKLITMTRLPKVVFLLQRKHRDDRMRIKRPLWEEVVIRMVDRRLSLRVVLGTPEVGVKKGRWCGQEE